jgi:hypothetical protein
MKKFTLLAVFLIVSVLSSFAEDRDLKDAIQVASSFINASTNMKRVTGKVQNNGVTLACAFYKGIMSADANAEGADLYLFNINNDGGFILVSGDKNTEPILGYSDKGNFISSKLPESMITWLKCYSEQIEYLRNNIAKAISNSSQIIYKCDTTSFPSSVEPLLGGIEWNQGSPYNMYCPVIRDTVTWTGCVATAMAQTIGYWKWPLHGYGSNQYKCTDVANDLSVNFSTTTYDWNNITEKYSTSSTDAQNKAVGTLMYHCGVAMGMQYGTKGSSPTGILSVEEAYKNHFGYTHASIIEHDYINQNAWTHYLKNELSNKRPVEYSGSGNGAHAFVLDGYNKNDYYHVNWGWGGAYNGYFLLSALTPLAGYDYSNHPWMTINVKPNDVAETSAEKMYFPTQAILSTSTTATKTGSNVFINIGSIGNNGYHSLIGDVGFGLYDGNGILVDSCKFITFGNAGVKRGQVVSGLSANYSIPKSLSDGVYVLRTVFKPTDQKKWLPVHPLLTVPNYLYLSVKSGAVSIIKPADYKNGIQEVSLSMKGTSLCQGYRATFNVKISNSGSDYHSYMGVLFVNKSDNSKRYLMGKKSVYVRANETRSITFEDSVTANIGDYNAYLVYDASNNPLEMFEMYSLGNALSLDVTNLTQPKFVLTKSLAVVGSENVHKDDIHLNDVHIKNVGAPFSGNVYVAVYDWNAKKWVGFFDNHWLSLATGEDTVINFSGSLPNVANGSYTAYIGYDYTIDGYSQLLGRYTTDIIDYANFTLTESTSISPIIDNCKIVNVYSLDGRVIKTNVDANSLQTILPAGIYIIDGKKIRISVR